MTQESASPPHAPSVDRGSNFHQEQQALSTIILALKDVDAESRARLLGTVATFFRIQPPSSHQTTIMGSGASVPQSNGAQVNMGAFSTDRTLSPKEFITAKQPQTDVERIACLAFYLTHYRDAPHFKTFDLSKLNTEAAQPKFTNAAYSTNNALKLGYLAQAHKGNKQISAAGERFVLALPDRDGAKKAMQLAKPKRKSRKNTRTSRGPTDK